MIMEKMRAYLWKLQPLFWTKGLIRLLDSGGPNAVSGSYTPRSRNFLRFHHFIGFLSRFLRKWWPVSENCSYGSGHMAWYLFWTKVAQMQFPGPRPKGQEIFWDSMILLDLSHDSSENDGLFVKIEAMVLDIYGLIPLLGPSGPDVVSGSQTPRSKNILRFHNLIGFISWFLRKWWPVCENWSYDSGHMAWYVFWARAQM